MNARTIIEALEPSDVRSRAAEIIRTVKPRLSKGEQHSAHQVIMWAQNDEYLMTLLGNDDDEEEAVLNEVRKQLAAAEDRTFKAKATRLKKSVGDTSDPIAHIRVLAKGRSWDEFKANLFGAALGGELVTDRTDEAAEEAFATMYNAARGANYVQTARQAAQSKWRLSDAKRRSDSSDTPHRVQMEQHEILTYYFPKGVPEKVTVYRGVPRPDVKIKPGDYCTLDRETARYYMRGPHGAILTDTLPSKDLVVDKATPRDTELIYWPPGSKGASRKRPPMTAKQLWAEANGVTESGSGRWLVTVQKFHDETPGFVQLDLVRDGHSLGSFSEDEAIRSGADIPDLSNLGTGQYWLDELK